MPRRKNKRGGGGGKGNAITALPIESNPAVISSSVKLKLTDAFLAFGDVEDIFEDKVINSDGGTILFTINVRRKFMKGDYIMHIVDTKIKKRDVNNAKFSAILCREDVDPLKINDLMKDSNFGSNFRCKNFLNRYDWKHFRNWGTFQCDEESADIDTSDSFNSSDDEDFDFYRDVLWNEDFYYQNGIADDYGSEGWEFFWTQVKGRGGDTPPRKPKKEKPPIPLKSAEEYRMDEVKLRFQNTLLKYFQNDTTVVRNCTFFINSERMSEISEGQFTIEKEGHWIYLIYGKNDNGGSKLLLGFFLKVTGNEETGLIAGDWHYGCVLQDKKTEECFAFIFGDAYQQETVHFAVNIEKNDYTYDIREFLRTEGSLPGANVYEYENNDTAENRKVREEIKKTKILEQYIRKATPTNVIVLNDEVWKHGAFNMIRPNESWESDPEIEGPACHLCNKIISSDVFSFVHQDVRYTVIFKKMIVALENSANVFIHKGGELQCCYCFNYFHRKKCTLSMSDSTYLSFKISKNWCCPLCVPTTEFCCKKYSQKKNTL